MSCYLCAGAVTQLHYVAHTATGNGSGSSTQNYAGFSAIGIYNRLGASNGNLDYNWEIYFKPDTQPYVFNTHAISIKAGNNGRYVKLKGVPDAGGLRPILQLGSTPLASSFNQNLVGQWLIHTDGSEHGTPEYASHIEIENLILDGDFDGRGAFTGPGGIGGYKSFAIDVYARTGRIKDVLVRRFGSNGEIPWSYYQSAGTETFPVSVWTKDGDKVSGDWNVSANQYPWVIENVEVTEFRSLHGGYATLIMPHVENSYYPINNSPTTWEDPIIAVRRCQVRGNLSTIALGTAGHDIGETTYASQGILYEDNVVLNSGTLLNTDTGAIGWLTLKRNAFLDIVTGAYLGRWNEGVGSYPAAHDSYRFQQNLYRLRGRANERDYHDYDEPASGSPQTNPNLALGRLYPKPSSALILQGRATRVTFEDNWLTTWPAADFFFPSPGTMPTAQYRVLYTPPPNVTSDARTGNWPRYPSSDVTFQNCKLSTEAFVFLPGAGSTGLVNEVNLTGNGKLASTPAYLDLTPQDAPYTDNQGNNFYGRAYSEDYQNLKTPVATASFTPKGKVERVQMLLDGSGHLERVREIVLGTCTLSGNQVTIQARVLDHWLPGTAAPGTVAAPTGEVSGKIYVRAEQFTDGQWVTLNNQAATANPNGSGVVQHTVTLTPVTGSLPAHGLVRVRAWINGPAAASAPNDLDENADAWASLDLPRGKVVTVDSLPDVGDDKNTAAAKRAKFLLTRQGDLDGSLTVRLRLRDHLQDPVSPNPALPDPRLVKPGTSTSLVANYGNSGTADYYLVGGGYTTGNQTLPFERDVTFSANQATLTLDVVPRVDNLTENNVIVLQVLPDPNTSSPTYAAGPQNRAEVLLWDGPEYTLVELTGAYQSTVYAADARAVNRGVVDAAGTWTVQPQAAGTATWQTSGPEIHGAVWTPASIYPATDLGATFRPYGISYRPSLAAGDRARLVGSYGSLAWRVLDDGTGGVQLPHFSGQSGPSLAWGISPDYSRAVGHSTLAGKKKPAMWVGTAAAVDLAQGLTDAANAVGEARAVNNAGVIVGSSSGFSTSDSLQRPFRNLGSGASLGNADWLPVPTGGTGVGRANAITSSGSTHYAVGWREHSSGLFKRAVLWQLVLGASPPSTATDLMRLVRSGEMDAASEALGINSALKVVGWSGASETDPYRRAVLYQDNAWLDLNDKHFTHGLDTSWTLQQANAISDTGVIVGLGTKSGSPRGFMLVPRVPGN